MMDEREKGEGVDLYPYLQMTDPSSQLPMVVLVEDDETLEQVAAAVELCVRKGLMNWRHGYVVMEVHPG